MNKRRSRRKPLAEINVVPYIDVTFVLLIIFMITAPLVQTGVDVELPQADSQTVEQSDDLPVIVSVDRSGQYYVDLGNQDDKPIDLQTLLVRVAAVLRNKPQTKVYIRGDQQVDYGKVVTVMAALKNAGLEAVGLMTQPYEQ